MSDNIVPSWRWINAGPYLFQNFMKFITKQRELTPLHFRRKENGQGLYNFDEMQRQTLGHAIFIVIIFII